MRAFVVQPCLQPPPAYEPEPKTIADVPFVERAIVQEIARHGVSNRFAIKSFRPDVGCNKRDVCTSGTLSEFDGGILISFECPGDRCVIIEKSPFMSFTGFAGWDSTGKAATSTRKECVEYVLFGRDDSTKACNATLGAAPAIHRFAGTFSAPGYTFVSDGDSLHRLTFALIDSIGYVYVRGKGRVIPATGAELRLGYR